MRKGKEGTGEKIGRRERKREGRQWKDEGEGSGEKEGGRERGGARRGEEGKKVGEGREKGWLEVKYGRHCTTKSQVDVISD